MAGMIAAAAVAGTVIGIVVGIVAMVSHGIHREQRRFDEQRRRHEEGGTWGGPEEPEYFPEEALDGVSIAARSVNGLYVRHPPTVRRHDAELAVSA